MSVQIIGVGAAVVGDMSSRPYWGLYELDFVFSTLVVRLPPLPFPQAPHCWLSCCAPLACIFCMHTIAIRSWGDLHTWCILFGLLLRFDSGHGCLKSALWYPTSNTCSAALQCLCLTRCCFSTGILILYHAAAAQVGSIVNFSLMYFLAPTAGASAGATNLLQKLFSEQTLLGMGAPGVTHPPILSPLPVQVSTELTGGIFAHNPFYSC